MTPKRQIGQGPNASWVIVAATDLFFLYYHFVISDILHTAGPYTATARRWLAFWFFPSFLKTYTERRS